MKATVVYKILSDELWPWLKQQRFTRLPTRLSWCRPFGNLHIVLWCQVGRYGWDRYTGSQFTVEVQLSEEAEAGPLRARRERLSALLDDDAREELRCLQNRVITGLPALPQDAELPHPLALGKWYASLYTPVTAPYPPGADIWLRYYTEEDVRRWGQFLLRQLPRCLAQAEKWILPAKGMSRLEARRAAPPLLVAGDSDEYLPGLVQRLCHLDPPLTNSADSISFKAHREAEEFSDPNLLRAAKMAVIDEQDKDRRNALYFIIGKVALNLACRETGEFLVQQLRREKDRMVIHYLLLWIADLSISPGADLSPVIELVKDKRWVVRHVAIQALAHTDSPAAEQAMLEVLATSSDKYDLEYANRTLSFIGTARSTPVIEPHCKSRTPDVRNSAKWAIAEIRKRVANSNIAADVIDGGG